MREINYETIEVFEVTVRIQDPYLKVSDFTKVLIQIEKEENFRGFVSIIWPVGQLPEITYHKAKDEN